MYLYPVTVYLIWLCVSEDCKLSYSVTISGALVLKLYWPSAASSQQIVNSIVLQSLALRKYASVLLNVFLSLSQAYIRMLDIQADLSGQRLWMTSEPLCALILNLLNSNCF